MRFILLLFISLFSLEIFPQDFNRSDSLRGNLSSFRSCYDVNYYDLNIVIDDKPIYNTTMNLKDAYNILSLPPNSELPNERVLKKAYRKSSLLHHPDRNLGDPDASERFQQVGAAYAYIIQQ